MRLSICCLLKTDICQKEQLRVLHKNTNEALFSTHSLGFFGFLFASSFTQVSAFRSLLSEVEFNERRCKRLRGRFGLVLDFCWPSHRNSSVSRGEVSVTLDTGCTTRPTSRLGCSCLQNNEAMAFNREHNECSCYHLYGRNRGQWLISWCFHDSRSHKI